MSDINQDYPILTPKDQQDGEEKPTSQKVNESNEALSGPLSFMGDTLGNIANYLKPKRVPPKRSVMKEFSPESVYLADTMKETSEKEPDKGLFKKLGGLLGLGGAGIASLGGKLFPQLMSKLPLLALAGGIIWAVIDGIKASLLADEWGVSKLSAGIGGILGGTGKGLKNAFKNMGKWALIGAGIGSFVPVIGTLAGGLIGAAVGFILGWIGGENLSKGIEKIKDKIIEFVQSGFVNSIIQFFKDFVNTGIETFLEKINIKGIWESDRNIADKIFDSIKNMASTLIESLFEGLITAVDNLLGEGNVISEGLNLLKDFIQPAIDIILSIPQSFIEGIMDASKLKEIWADEDASFGEKLGMTIANLAEMLIGGIVNMVQTVGPKLIDFIKNIFTKNEETGEDALGKRFLDVLATIGEKMLNFVWDMLQGIYKGIDAATGGKVTEAMNWVNEKLIQPIGDFFQQIPDTIKDYKDKVFDWVETKIVDPIKDFFGLISEKLATARLDFAQYTAKASLGGVLGISEKEVIKAREFFEGMISDRQLLQILRSEEGNIKQALMDLYEKTREFKTPESQGEYLHSRALESKDIQNVEDAIIKPTGEVIRTSPEDTIIATKNNVNNSNTYINEKMLQILQRIEEKTGKGGKGNIIQNNFASKYSPDSVMRQLRVSEVL